MKNFLFFIFILHMSCVEDKSAFKNARLAGLIKEIDSTYDSLSGSLNEIIGVEKKSTTSLVSEAKEEELSIASVLCKLKKQKSRFIKEGSAQYADILFQMKQLLAKLYENDDLSGLLNVIMESLGPSTVFDKDPREVLRSQIREQLRGFNEALLKLEISIK